MPETYIPLEDAAKYEGLTYKGMASRIKRNPEQYKTQTVAREGGGKDQVRVAVSSLSPKARKAHKAAQKIDGGEVIIENRAKETPWYVVADLNHYIEGHKKQYFEAVELAARVQEFIDYDGPDKTEFAKGCALGLGKSVPTLYRLQAAVLEANAWAMKLENEDGKSRDYFRALAMCRKPKDKDTFPSLPPEQRALIENIWFDDRFANNNGTMEMLYETFQEQAALRDWATYPSLKTVSRYINYLMETPGAESARFLAANGKREWKNRRMVKALRDSTSLDVMELVVGDEHTFDLWVQWTAPNGKVKAVRPVLVAWMDQRSRCFLGDVICVKANSQTLKESLVKMIYDDLGGVPQNLQIDNGKDYTAETMTGQNRKDRKITFEFDAETKGFYQSIGIQNVGRAKPYEPWVKTIERLFGTVAGRFSKKFESYVGTLTASKTDAKRKKDIQGMLERGELLTMEEFYEIWIEWKNWYHHKVHRGLKDAGEQWHTPIEVFQNAQRYQKAAPPQEYAAMLLMKADRARVYNYGIRKFGAVYTDAELAKYVGQTVGVKWSPDDVSTLYIYTDDGRKICEAVSAEVLGFLGHCSQETLEKHQRAQKQQMKDAEKLLKDFTTPYEARLEEGRPSDAVGKLDLTIKANRKSNTIAFPQDKEYRAELASKRTRKQTGGDEFLLAKAGGVLEQLRAMNE